MPRPAARISHDEVARMVKAVRACGLQVARVIFDGRRVEVVVDNAEKVEALEPTGSELLREPVA